MPSASYAPTCINPHHPTKTNIDGAIQYISSAPARTIPHLNQNPTDTRTDTGKG